MSLRHFFMSCQTLVLCILGYDRNSSGCTPGAPLVANKPWNLGFIVDSRYSRNYQTLQMASKEAQALRATGRGYEQDNGLLAQWE